MFVVQSNLKLIFDFDFKFLAFLYVGPNFRRGIISLSEESSNNFLFASVTASLGWFIQIFKDPNC